MDGAVANDFSSRMLYLFVSTMSIPVCYHQSASVNKDKTINDATNAFPRLTIGNWQIVSMHNAWMNEGLSQRNACGRERRSSPFKVKRNNNESNRNTTVEDVRKFERRVRTCKFATEKEGGTVNRNKEGHLIRRSTATYELPSRDQPVPSSCGTLGGTRCGGTLSKLLEQRAIVLLYFLLARSN